MALESSYFDSGTQQFELSLNGLTEGFYMLRIKHKGGWRQMVKLIVD